MKRYKITTEEMAQFEAEMAELATLEELPSEEDIEEMARWYGEE